MEIEIVDESEVKDPRKRKWAEVAGQIKEKIEQMPKGKVLIVKEAAASKGSLAAGVRALKTLLPNLKISASYKNLEIRVRRE